MKPPARNPLAKLDDKELVWLLGILKDACRERLEKNLIHQALEETLHARRGPVAGRVDPRRKLKEWEPRYRKFLEVATELHEQMQAATAADFAAALYERLSAPASSDENAPAREKGRRRKEQLRQPPGKSARK